MQKFIWLIDYGCEQSMSTINERPKKPQHISYANWNIHSIHDRIGTFSFLLKHDFKYIWEIDKYTTFSILIITNCIKRVLKYIPKHELLKQHVLLMYTGWCMAWAKLKSYDIIIYYAHIHSQQ